MRIISTHLLYLMALLLTAAINVRECYHHRQLTQIFQQTDAVAEEALVSNNENLFRQIALIRMDYPYPSFEPWYRKAKYVDSIYHKSLTENNLALRIQSGLDANMQMVETATKVSVCEGVNKDPFSAFLLTSNSSQGTHFDLFVNHPFYLAQNAMYESFIFNNNTIHRTAPFDQFTPIDTVFTTPGTYQIPIKYRYKKHWNSPWNTISDILPIQIFEK